MIALWMLYAAVVAALAGVAAAAAEPVVRLWRGPTRLVWALALVATVAAPTALVLRPTSPSDAGSVAVGAPVAVATLGAGAAAAPSPLHLLRARSAAALGAARGRLGPLDGPLLAAWGLLSGAAAAALLVSAARLRRRRRAWRPATVDGTPVLVAPDAGPAVMGGGAHRIVLPTWALALDAPLRAMVLRHEAEHLRAGDPRLLLAGVLAVVLMPWSPAVWWQVRRLRLAVELDCDRRVLGAIGDVERYGLLLLAVSQRGGGMLRLAIPALSEGATDLERRIAAMTARPPRRPAVRVAALGAATALAVATACVVPSPNVVSGPGGADTTSAPAARRDAPPAPTVADPGQTFFEFQVEQPVTVVNGVAPAYPADLKAAGTSGQVIAQFVVDTTGKADVATFKAIESSDPRFTAAVFNALPAMQFAPALVGGRKVKQLVQQAFAFSLETPLRAPGAPPTGERVLPQASVRAATPRATDAPRPAPPPDTRFEFQVEQPAQAVEPVTPEYPAELRAQGVRGTVIAQVVIDTTGAPMMPSFKVLETAHPLFTAAVREALARTRFTPARVDGKAVRQLVQQAYSFAPPPG